MQLFFSCTILVLLLLCIGGENLVKYSAISEPKSSSVPEMVTGNQYSTSGRSTIVSPPRVE